MIRRLGDIASFRRGLTYSKGDETPLSNKRVLRSNNIDLESSSLDLSEIKFLRDDFIIPEDRKLVANSIFICMSNGSKQHVGKVAFIEKDMDYAFGGFMGLIVPSTDVSAKYVFYACQSSAYRSFLSKVGNGIGITNLRFSDLENFEFPVPSLNDQNRIVAELDLLSGIIEKRYSQLKTLEDLSESIFYEMFGEPDDSPFEVVRLSQLSKEKLSYGSGASAIEYNGDVRYVRITDIQEDGTLTQTPVSPDSFDAKYLLHKGDILFARSGATVGKTYLYSDRDGKAIYAGYLIRFIPDTSIILPEYVFHFTRSQFYKAFVRSNAQAVAQPNINAQQYGNLSVNVPPMEMQRSFAKKISAIDSQISVIKQSIQATKDLLSSRMDSYFCV